MQRLLLSVIVISILTTPAFPQEKPAFSPDETEFYSVLSLSQEPGAVVLGKAVFQVRGNGTELYYRIEVNGIKDITMAHLHLGKLGNLSTPVAWLYPKSPPPKLIPGEFTGVLAEGILTAKDFVGPLRGNSLSTLIALMREGKIFVNIHAREFAAGEICGVVECPIRE